MCHRKHIGVGERLGLGFAGTQHLQQGPASRSMHYQPRGASVLVNIFRYACCAAVTCRFAQLQITPGAAFEVLEGSTILCTAWLGSCRLVALPNLGSNAARVMYAYHTAWARGGSNLLQARPR